MGKSSAAVVACLLFAGVFSASSHASSEAESRHNEPSARYFEANRGQWPAGQAFRAYGYGYGVALGADGVTLELAQRAAKAPKEVSLKFEGASGTAQLTGGGELAAKGAWFAGDEANWRSGIPLYERVRMSGVYAGVDATFYGRDGRLEYDLDVAAGGKASGLVLDLEGADDARIGEDGDVTIAAGGQQIVLRRPLAWQTADGTGAKRPVEVSYALLPAAGGHAQRIAIKVGEHDAAKALTIDPVLTFATYLSSAANDQVDDTIADLALDSANNVYVLSAGSNNNQTTVQKFTAAGVLTYTNTFTSTGSMYPVALRVGTNGEAYVAGAATGGYPTTSTAYQKTWPDESTSGNPNGALSVVSADGSKLVYSTYFGGNDFDEVFGLAVDGSGNAYLVGQANGTFPTTAGVIQENYYAGSGIAQAGFVAKLNPAASGTASLLYSTLLGGYQTSVNAVAVDSAGDAYVAIASDGVCNVQEPITPGAIAYSGLAGNESCGYAAELNPKATGLVYFANYGPGSATAIAIDGNHDVYLTGGSIRADDFPTTAGAYQTAYPDGFALELNPTGGLVYSTFLSGPSGGAASNYVSPQSIALEPGCVSACEAYISGQVSAADFPLVAAIGEAPPVVASNYPEGFLVVLNGTGTAALTSGYVSGWTSKANTTPTANYAQVGFTPHVGVDTAGNAWLAGTVADNEFDFPVTTTAPDATGSWLAEISMANGGKVVANPNSVAYGNTIPVNVSSTALNGAATSIMLRNMGNEAVTLSSIVASPSVFRETDNCNGQIAAGGTCTAQVAFTPGTDAAINGALTVTSTGLGSPLTIALSGQGADVGFVSATPATLQFGNQALGTASAPQAVTVTNLGDEQVSIQGDIYFSPAAGFSQVNNCPGVLPPGGSCQVQVTFAPGATQAGAQSTQLSYGPASNAWVNVSGVGVEPASAGGTQSGELSATGFNFGSLPVGATTGAQSATLFNTGSQSLNILAASITLTSARGTASDFQIVSNNLGAQSLLPGYSLNIRVTFTPSAVATETATLLIPVAGGSPITMSLVGQGVAVTPSLVFSPATMIFPDTIVGSAAGGGAAQTFYLFNQGNTPFLVDRVVASGDFAVTATNCPGDLLPATAAPGNTTYQECYAQVVFAPTQAGVRTGTLTIYDAAGSPQVTPLMGNGIAAVGQVSVNPTALAFGTVTKGAMSAEQYVTLSNYGDIPVSFTAATASQDYAVTGGNCGVLPYTIQPGNSCDVTVVYSPTVTTSPDNGTLTLATSAGNQTVMLTGAGQAATVAAGWWPSSINFGTVVDVNDGGNYITDDSAQVSVYVRNAGTENLTFSSAATVTGEGYSTNGDCDVDIPGEGNTQGLTPGQYCSIIVSFLPTATGTRTGTLTINTSAGVLKTTLTGQGVVAQTLAGVSYAQPPVISFGPQAVKSVSAPMTAGFDISSGSASTVTFNGVSITSGGANFQIATGPNAQNNCSGGPYQGGEGCDVAVVFSPTATGYVTGTLTLSTSVGNFTASLNGYALPASNTAIVTPTALSFPGQIVSTITPSYESQTVTLTNNGAAGFTVGTVGGTNVGPTSEFQVQNDQCSGAGLVTANSSYGAGGSCTMYVYFAPSAAGTRSGTLTIPVTYADGTTGTYTASLTGVGIAQRNEAVLSTASALFPNTPVGSSNPGYFPYITLTNSGNLPLTVGTLTGTDTVVGASTAGDFTTTASNTFDECSGTNLAPGQTCSVAIAFLPQSVGAKTGSVTFPVTYANATKATPLTVTLGGLALADGAAITMEPTGVEFGPMTAGSGSNTYDQPIVAVNTGNVPVTLSKYVLSTGFVMDQDLCTGVTLAPGANCYYDVYFNPGANTAGTTIQGTLAVYSNAAGSPQTVTLTGQSIAVASGLQFSQTSVNFGTLLTGNGGQQTMLLVNTGSKAATVSALTISGTDHGDFTESDGCVGRTLQPYDYCDIFLTFTPGAVGARSGLLKETDSLAGSGRSVTLSGMGVTSYANVALFPASLAFSTQQPVGEGSAQQFFSLTYTGSSSLVIGQISSSDATEFPITEDGCSGQTVSSGQSCRIGVEFSPNSAGAKTAHISIPDNIAGSPQLEPLSGTGVTELTSSVSLTALPASVAFGSPVALIAGVKDQNGKALTNGSVTFYDGTTVLGTAQVVSTAAGGHVVGTATLNTILTTLGANSITAKYAGGDAKSTSTAVAVTVTGKYPTTTVFTSSGTAGNYTFTGTVSGGGPIAPTGGVTFTDTQTLLVPGTAQLNATTLAQSFVSAPLDTGLATPLAVAFADVNDDGILDLVTGTQGNGVMVQLGNGDGTFQAIKSFQLGSSNYGNGLAFGDFNGDGNLDIAVALVNGIGVLVGNGDGTFQAMASVYDSGGINSVAVGDVDGDGKLDLVGGDGGNGTIDVLLGNGDGTFQQPAVIPMGGNPGSIVLGDFNGDGKLDIAVSDAESSYAVGVLLGNGNGTFLPVKTSPTMYYANEIAAADMDGDGKLDLVTNDSGTAIGVLLGNGDGTFKTELTAATGGVYAGIPAVSDLNGDGKPDIAVISAATTLSVLYGKGDGTFPTTAAIATAAGPTAVALGDMNHDGRLDIVVADQTATAGEANVYLNHVTQTAVLSSTLAPGTGTHPLSAVYNGDTHYAPSTSNTLKLTASLITPKMVPADEPSATVPWAQQLTVSVTLRGAYAWVPAPTGSVSYSIDGGAPLSATVVAGAVSIPIAQLSVGAHNIAVSYGGDQYYAALAAQTLAVTIVPASQTITFSALPAVTYGTAPITLAATASSGLGVTFSVTSGPGTLKNNVLTITGAGTVVIAAAQGGNVDYNAAKTVSQSLTVNKAPLTVAPASVGKVYGAALPALSGSVSGLVNGDTLGGTVVVSYSTTATAASAVGTYAVTAAISGSSSADYSLALIPASLTVTKAVLTFTANNLSSVYGQAPPALTYAVNGLVNGDTAATAFTGAPALATTVTAKSVAGSYPITIAAGTLVSANYSFTFVSGTLTVGTAVLTVTPVNTTSVYGAVLPTLTFTLKGFVNGDTAAKATTGAPSLTTTATAGSGAGTYPITAAQGTLAAANYSFSFATGTLTITKAPLTVTANNASSVYGAGLPAFTSAFSGFVNGDTSAAVTGAPSYTSTATAKSGVGSYTVTPAAGTLAAANYKFIFVAGTLTITQAKLAVVAANLSSVYGAALPTLTYSLNGLVNGDTAATAAQGVPALATTATAMSPVGSYPITVTAGTLISVNYSLTYTNGALTITKAPLTLTATSLSSVYGVTLPALTDTLTGFVNGDTAATATTGAAKLSTTGTSRSNPGSYPINVAIGTLAAVNYAITPVNGTLTIKPAPLTVTVMSATKVYGAVLPTLSGTVTGKIGADAITVTYSTAATKASGVGAYAITATVTGAKALDYTVTVVAGTLTITKAVLKATANNFTIKAGDAIPTLTYTLTGFVNSDTQATAVTGAAVLSTTATKTSAAGTYPITITNGTLAAANYSFTDVDGTLTITN